MRQLRAFILVVSLLIPTCAAAAQKAIIKTDRGDITIELYTEKTPLSVENFLTYAKSGNYDRTIFHRVVHGYVIQGGGYSKYFNERPTRDPIPYEGDNGLKNIRGTIAMARGDDPNSAQAQWFINLRDNPKLDHKIVEGLPLYGYAVFGKVVDGLEIADEIGAAPTGAGGPFEAEVPLEAIVIKRIDEVK